MTTLATESRVLTNRLQSEQAQELLENGVTGAEVRVQGSAHPVPPELMSLLKHVVRAVAEGRSLTISTVPEDLTTVMAARMIGVSRPTLMKMIAQGELPSHKVGSHTRLKSADVFAFLDARQVERREAFEDLRNLLDD